MTILPPIAREIVPPDPSATAADPPALPTAKPLSPPFLVWPVSRREFYRTIWMAMVPALLWGVVVYGVRALAMLLAAVVATTCIHLLLRRGLGIFGQRWRWPRGHCLVYAHSLGSVLVLVALAHPLWPVWVVISAAVLVPLMLAAIGGPGRERIHVAVALALAIQFAIMPLLIHRTYAGGAGGTGGDAVLARDRLIMGDVRQQQSASLWQWPTSRQLGGDDAVKIIPPAASAYAVFDHISHLMAGGVGRVDGGSLSSADLAQFHNIFDNAFANDLPAIEMQIAGATTGRIGTASFIAITLAGLYLAYRYILRPRSVAIFICAFCLGTLAITFWPSAISGVGLLGMWHFFKTFPGEIGSLLSMILLNSDAPFAAVFILALPGTEPLTPRGRRAFLVLTGLLAALLHRADPAIPAASLAFCTLMPTSRLFDRLFAQRSWLNAGM